MKVGGGHFEGYVEATIRNGPEGGGGGEGIHSHT